MSITIPIIRKIASQQCRAMVVVACALGGMYAANSYSQQTLFLGASAGYAGQGSADGTGSNAQFYLPAGTAMDAAGNIYVTDSGNNTIRTITSAGVVSTLAGLPGVAGSADGLGTNALFNNPQGIAVDGAGNLYVADSGNDTIRKITPAGAVTTLAGFPGAIGSVNGTGTNALFSQPQGVAVDSATNLYVADYGNNTIRKITPAAVVTTLAGNSATNGTLNATGTNALFYQPQGIAVDAAQNVYVSDTANATIRKITSAGVVTTLAGSAGTNGSANATGTNAQFYQPLGIGLDSATNLYVADSFNNTIRKITPAGVVTTLAGAAGTNGSMDGLTNKARFWSPDGVVVDGSGNLFVADYFNGTIRKVTSTGTVTTFAGSPSAASVDGSSSTARFNVPLGAAVDTLGNVYVADSANSTIRKITPLGQVSTFAGSPGVFGSADGLGTNALFNSPQAVAVDGANNIYVADTLNHTIRKITSSGAVITFAGFPGVSGLNDGTGTNAQFFKPQGIVVDSVNNVYVADTLNYTIRKITAAGTVSTLAGLVSSYGSVDSTTTNAMFNWPKGLALDGSNNLYVADCLNHTIRQVTPSGTVTTLAGLAGSYGSTDGTNNGALFFEPSDVVVDSSNNVLVADSGNHVIRKLTPSGTNWVVTTIAGLAGAAGSSNGTGTAARFDFPTGIALDSSGGVYIADTANNSIRLDGAVVVPLVISNVTVVSRRNSAVVSWSTSANSSSQVAFGTTAAYGSLSQFDPTPVTSHSSLLVGLVTNTTYFYEVISSNAGTVATNVGTFSTDNTIIVQAAQANYTGVWILNSGGSDRFSATDRFAGTVTTNDSAEAFFRPTIVLPAQYDVYYWYSEGANRSVDAPLLVTYQGGSVNTALNETLPGGNWQLVASSVPFAAGTNSFLRVGNGTGESSKIVIADAARWTYSAGQDIPVGGNVPAWWAQFYFGSNPVNSASPGANGYSLLTDYILGISPTDPNTLLNFNLKRTTNGFQAVFSPCLAGGRQYQLQGATNLVNPAWTNVPNLTLTQTNTTGALTATSALGTKTFFRLSVVLTP